jgi:hypothetical protein
MPTFADVHSSTLIPYCDHILHQEGGHLWSDFGSFSAEALDLLVSLSFETLHICTGVTAGVRKLLPELSLPLRPVLGYFPLRFFLRLPQTENKNNVNVSGRG